MLQIKSQISDHQGKVQNCNSHFANGVHNSTVIYIPKLASLVILMLFTNASESRPFDKKGFSFFPRQNQWEGRRIASPVPTALQNSPPSARARNGTVFSFFIFRCLFGGFLPAEISVRFPNDLFNLS